jgi:DNA (cytosine-5)-methyltransferase 1
MRFLSVCSGIEAASVAWAPLGWEASGFSEIEPFPSAVLKHHYPDVPNHGDMTQLPAKIRAGDVEAPDLLCGGTPCQAFSVAGLRQSLDDARGNLTLTFCEIADAIDSVRKQPAIIFWENVPGVLNTKDNAFGCFLGALAGEDDALVAPGGRWANAGFIDGPQRAVAWRVLDAQYFGVAQRRRRVFVVASARADFDPAAVLFEFEGVRRDIAPSRETGQKVAGTVTSSAFSGGASGKPEGAAAEHFQPITMAHGQGGAEIGFDRGPTLTCNHEAPITAYALADTSSRDKNQNGAGWKADGTMYTLDTTGLQGVAQPIPFDTTQITSPSNYSRPKEGDPCHPLAAAAHVPAIAQPVAFAQNTRDEVRYINGDGAIAGALAAETGMKQQTYIKQLMAVRRLTPVECERLQGFPDNYTNIPWRKATEAPDGPRYKALGNSWAVPVVRWIGERIERALA